MPQTKNKTHKQQQELAEEAFDHTQEAGAIPAPETGGHPLSPAAHLGGTVHDHTKPAGNLRHGAAPGELREPPMDIRRIGKQHR